jgi:hypothetical protein
MGEAMLMTGREIKRAIDSALNMLYDCDDYLLRTDANERSITFKLGCYLESLLIDWDVDFEYNRDGHAANSFPMKLEKITSDDANATTVFPDLIVHKRGTNINLLAIEVNKLQGNDQAKQSEIKLKAFKDFLGYQYAVLLILKTGKECPGIIAFNFIE